MNRRRFLRGTAAIGTAGIAGCLEGLGFEEESALANPPLVENRPDAVYLPASREEMGMYGSATDGDYAIAFSYTFPHRFWTVEATADGKQLVEVEADDSLHLMATLWDRETGTVLPVDMRLEIRRDGSPIDGGTLSPWPMISQRMGFHYGDNVRLPGEGEYTVRARAGPLTLDRVGAFEGRFESAASLAVTFEYARSDVTGLSFDSIEPDRRGSPDALPLMNHGGGEQGGNGDGGSGHVPTGQGPSIESLPGDHLGTDRSGDAKLSAIATDADRFTDGGTYLAITPRTPYNDIILPFTSLSASIERDGSTLHEESLTETLDGEFGHHYGLEVDELTDGDRVTVTVDSAPQVSRHDGYETAFFEFEALTYTV
ncbi:iron transporter [Natrinema salsiterrestre]|uniref:Iron transporter n=1 Tax=Natrinema salsiterrestre TaxID=2950540 RepID=A0A9Q4L226_9EURY|nr:iron transporter [Natrinema salsiterrestre]MDF9745939.1 iron transporter [Natrinema salsiterrestre]